MFYTYFLLFIIYSFIGWIGEIILSIIVNKKASNRGFLMGPYCPIYGCGCILLILLLDKYQNDPISLFALSVLICAILEYFTSWIMEVIFKMRWWDYSNIKFNINGRICLESIIPFGIIGVLIVTIINPFFLNLINKLPVNWINNIAVVIFAIFIIDIIISSNVIFNFKSLVKESKKDSTDDIKKFVKKSIKDNKFFYNRLLNAFPNLKKIVKKKNKKKK